MFINLSPVLAIVGGILYHYKDISILKQHTVTSPPLAVANERTLWSAQVHTNRAYSPPTELQVVENRGTADNMGLSGNYRSLKDG